MGRKLSQEEFVSRSNIEHKNKYNYSKVIYINSKAPVTIVCPIHGNFLQKPNKHLYNKRGCPTCGGTNNLGLKEFITRSSKLHKDKYDYSLVDYKNTKTKVKIICPEHGEFEQVPTSHLKGIGCQKCGFIKTGLKGRITLANFIIRANKLHKDKYNYNKTNFNITTDKTVITCLIHGDFTQNVACHLAGNGCPECALNLDIHSKKCWVKQCDKKSTNEPKVYIIRCFNKNEEFIKIGISFTTYNKRFRVDNMPYSYEVIKEIKGSANFVWDKEKELHRQFKKYKYKPLISFGGETECFNMDILKFVFN